MNGTVLALLIAGVCVIAGIALIVVAILLGRKEGEDETSTVSEASAAGTHGGRTFIDDPLETDLGSQLGPDKYSTAPSEGIPPTGEDAPIGSVPLRGVRRGQTRGDWDPEAIPAPIRAGGSGPRQASYDFRVQLAYRALMSGEFARTIAELRQAFALTDDADARTEILIEIGHSSRMTGDFPGARAAYLDAITYSTDPLVWDNLHHWIEELADHEEAAGAAEHAPAETDADEPTDADGPTDDGPEAQQDGPQGPVEDDAERGA